MKGRPLSRRSFLKSCASAAAVGAFPKTHLLADSHSPYDPRGLQTRVLGRTGVRVPLIVFGGGSRFCTVKDPDRSMELLEYALDHGFYYWDTAHIYEWDGVRGEERCGAVLKDRRREVFLATKLSERTYDGAMRQLEKSLQRLQTDHLELLQIHSVESLEDVDRIGAADGVLEAVLQARDEGVTRFVGFTGHTSAEAMAAMARRYDLDTMLIAMNHQTQGREDFEHYAIPAAAERNMGILAMKVIRPRETVEGLQAERLIRYALSLRHVHATVIGMDGMDVLRNNLAVAKNFQPLPPAQMERVRLALRPFFESSGPPWLRPGYRDGALA